MKPCPPIIFLAPSTSPPNLLISSFGQSAIFLIGGKSKQVKPTPILLRSGDVIVMASDARLSYHGVPRVLAPREDEMVPVALSAETIKCSSCQSVEAVASAAVVACGNVGTSLHCAHCQTLVSTWPNFVSYLSMSRININVRQVISEKYKF